MGMRGPRGEYTFGVVQAETDTLIPNLSEVPRTTRTIMGCYSRAEALEAMCKEIDKYLAIGYQVFDNQDKEMIILKKSSIITPLNAMKKQFILFGYRDIRRSDNSMRLGDYSPTNIKGIDQTISSDLNMDEVNKVVDAKKELVENVKEFDKTISIE